MSGYSKDSILVLRINLDDTKIWRRLEVPASSTLRDIHALMMVAVGWIGGHLHIFEIGEDQYGDPESLQDDNVIDESKARLYNILSKRRRSFKYTYDFGDNWSHTIVIEQCIDPESGIRYPRCTGGEKACPPNDCGGVGGYEYLLEVINDPSHDEHESMVEWLDDDNFNPDKFDIDRVNKVIQDKKELALSWF